MSLYNAVVRELFTAELEVPNMLFAGATVLLRVNGVVVPIMMRPGMSHRELQEAVWTARDAEVERQMDAWLSRPLSPGWAFFG